ncbi:MAG: hypothetical protein IPF54_26045 [Draconibacterium sp.]|nr:hypothetical protein [Draconibacterium sp.]
MPFFDSIREEPRFQNILKDVEAKYQVNHERVGKWLKEKKTTVKYINTIYP